jgi:hypothetical protein
MINSAVPFPLSLIIRYFWLLAIVLTILNVPSIKAKINPYIKQDPLLDGGYNRLITGFVLGLIIPWLVMGIGMIFGKFDTIFDIMFGQHPWNAFSAFYFGMIIAEAILFLVWIWFGDGVGFLLKHPGILEPRSGQSPAWLKRLAATMLAASLLFPILVTFFPIGPF